MRHDKFILKSGDMPPLLPVCAQAILGKSAAARDLRQMIELAAMANYPVLLTGPVGSGKESVARALHAASQLGNLRFIPINCAQMPRDALADALADNAIAGVRYIDGVEHLDPELQLTLIKRIDRDTVSGHRSSRVIAATSACLTRSIADGLFAKNLYYRLSLLNIPVPALRQRREDIATLVDHLVKQIERKSRFTLEKAAWDILIAHDWLGNLRELHIVMARAASFHPGCEINAVQMRALIDTGIRGRRNCGIELERVRGIEPL